MNHTPARRHTPLPHLHRVHLSHQRPRPARTPQRTHRQLVRLGRVLLVVGPLLAAVHLLLDTQSSGSSGTFWTYTVASLEAAVITTIVGIALAWREPRGAHNDPR